MDKIKISDVDPDDLVKVTFHFGAKETRSNENQKLVRYIHLRSDYALCIKEIRNKFKWDNPSWSIYWIDSEKDKVRICDEDDYSAFMRLTSGLRNRHIHVE